MEAGSGVGADLLAREAELRALNDALNEDVAAVRNVSAALHQSIASRATAGWSADLGDDEAAPLAAPKQHPSKLQLRARHAAVAEQRALDARAQQDENSGGALSSRIPTLKPRAAGRVSAGGPAFAPPGGVEALPCSVGTEAETYIDPDLPLETQVKLLRSHLRVAKHELAEARGTAVSATQEAGEAKKAAAAAGEERARLNRTVTTAEAALEKARKAVASAEAREVELRAQVAGSNKGSNGRDARREEAGVAAMDARVARAQEEAEKLKVALAAERTGNAEQHAVLRRELESSQAAVKRVERQRNELLVALKKCMRLVSVLKRQRLHMEAARLLAFTEEEFAKAIGV